MDEGILNSNLTAQQFADALTVYGQYLQSDGNNKLMDKMLSILYCEGEYNSEQADQLTNSVSWVDAATKQAVLYNFMAIQSFLLTKTKYYVLFNSNDSETKKTKSQNSLGFSGAIYSMVRKVYCDLERM